MLHRQASCGDLIMTLQASTDTGEIMYMDSRKQSSTVFTLKAHSSAVSGMTQCKCYSNCLATVSTDGSMKIWDVDGQRPSCVYEKKFDDRVGILPPSPIGLLARMNFC